MTSEPADSLTFSGRVWERPANCLSARQQPAELLLLQLQT